MEAVMEFSGLRWRYRIRNSVVDVDNAIGRGGWSQERLIVNGEPLYAGGGLLRFFVRTFEEPWLTEQGETLLKVRMWPGLTVIKCRLTVGGESVPSDEMFSAEWQGPRGHWPDEGVWRREAMIGGGYPTHPRGG
jgi:hypothetical protein